MKKLIALFLALLMTFSVVTVAFAAEDETPAPDESSSTQTPAEEEKSNELFDLIVKALIGDGSIENIPLPTAKAALKVAKILLKLAKAFIKVGDALGFIDGDQIFLNIVNSIAGMIAGGNEEAPAEPAPETPAEPVGDNG